MAEQSYSRWGAFGGGPNDQPIKKATPPDQGSVGFGSNMSGPNKGTPLEEPQQMQDMKYRVPAQQTQDRQSSGQQWGQREAPSGRSNIWDRPARMRQSEPEPEFETGVMAQQREQRGRESNRDFLQPRRQQPNFWDQAEGASQREQSDQFAQGQRNRSLELQASPGRNMDWDKREQWAGTPPSQGNPNEGSQPPQSMGMAQSPQQSFGRSQQSNRESWMNRGGGGPQEFDPPPVESEGSPRGGYQNMREQVFPQRPSQQSQGFNQPQARRRPPGIRYNRGSQNSGGSW